MCRGVAAKEIRRVNVSLERLELQCQEWRQTLDLESRLTPARIAHLNKQVDWAMNEADRLTGRLRDLLDTDKASVDA